MEFTLFEVHFPNADFNAPFARREGSVTERSKAVITAGSGPKRAAVPVAALLALVGVVLVARYLRGGKAEQTTLDEVEA